MVDISTTKLHKNDSNNHQQLIYYSLTIVRYLENTSVLCKNVAFREDLTFLSWRLSQA